MDIPWLEDIPLWVVAILFMVVLYFSLESGIRFGLRRRNATKSAEKNIRGDVTLTSMLALLGLMLAFTYAFAMSRADARKHAIIDEVNAISTAFIRADLLAEPGRSDVRARLLDFARTRAITHEIINDNKAREAMTNRTLKAQSQIWPAFKRTLQGRTPGPYEVSMMHAINEVLDAQSKRMAIAYDRIPMIVFFLLLAIAAFSLAVVGNNAGLSGRINRWRINSFVLILTALTIVILDFDRPQSGLIRLSNAPSIALIEEMEKASTN